MTACDARNVTAAPATIRALRGGCRMEPTPSTNDDLFGQRAVEPGSGDGDAFRQPGFRAAVVSTAVAVLGGNGFVPETGTGLSGVIVYCCSVRGWCY